MIDIDLYLEVSDLFRCRWEPAILAILADGPHRYGQLLRRLDTHTDDRIADNVLTRGLNRLGRANQIHVTRTRIGRRDVNIYTITGAGRRAVGIYNAVIDVYRSLQAPARVDVTAAHPR